MSLAPARALRAKKGTARRLAASRERKKILFIMVCLIGVPISRAPGARQCSNTGNVKNPDLCNRLRGNLQSRCEDPIGERIKKNPACPDRNARAPRIAPD